MCAKDLSSCLLVLLLLGSRAGAEAITYSIGSSREPTRDGRSMSMCFDRLWHGFARPMRTSCLRILRDRDSVRRNRVIREEWTKLLRFLQAAKSPSGRRWRAYSCLFGSYRGAIHDQMLFEVAALGLKYGVLQADEIHEALGPLMDGHLAMKESAFLRSMAGEGRQEFVDEFYPELGRTFWRELWPKLDVEASAGVASFSEP